MTEKFNPATAVGSARGRYDGEGAAHRPVGLKEGHWLVTWFVGFETESEMEAAHSAVEAMFKRRKDSSIADALDEASKTLAALSKRLRQ